jgi:FAD/FMN-containing dehydrogenase
MTARELQEIIDTETFIDDESILEQYSGDMNFVPRIRPRCVTSVKKTE